MQNRIRLRRDTAINWTANNPILGLGEPGVEIDTNRFKFGDGSTTWENLAYVAGEGGGSGAGITARLFEVVTATKSTWDIAYTVGYVDVWVNGIKIQPDAFTANNSTTITLNEELIATPEAPQIIEIIAGTISGDPTVHVHNNKEIIDQITQENLDAWNTPTANIQSINDINDVDTLTVAPVHGQTLSWDNNLQKWIPGIIIYVQDTEPVDAPENSIWINTATGE